MKLIYALSLASVSCSLTRDPLPPPQPNGQAHIVYLADSAFTLEELILLQKACIDWSAWTGDRVTCSIQQSVGRVLPDWNQWRITKQKSSTTTQLTHGLAEDTLAYTWGHSIVILYDRLNSEVIWEGVSAHEMGHSLGLSHVDGGPCENLMYPNSCPVEVPWGDLDRAECRELGYCVTLP